jgi:hypothetical protein
MTLSVEMNKSVIRGDSSVSTVTRLRAGRYRVQIPTGTRHSSLLQKILRTLLFNGTGAISVAVEWLGLEADLSNPFCRV